MKTFLVAAAVLLLPFTASAATTATITTTETDPAPTRATTPPPPPATGTTIAPPPPSPQSAGADYLLEIDGIKGESKDDTKASADMFLEIDGIKGESKDDTKLTPALLEIDGIKGESEAKKKGNVEYNWKVEEGEKGGVQTAVGDITGDGQPLTPDFSILLGGSGEVCDEGNDCDDACAKGDEDCDGRDDDCDDSGKDGTTDRKTGDCDDADKDSGPSSDKLTGLARARQVLIDNAKASDQAIESISFNFEKIQVNRAQEVKLFGFIPTTVTATVEIDGEAKYKVKYPWWVIFVSGKDDSVGESVFNTLSNVLKTKHDTIKNSIGNVR